MSRNHKKGRYSNKQNPCPACSNTKGSCKLNHDGSIYCYHSTPDSAPSDYLHIRELTGGMGHEFIEPHITEELLRAATELQSRGKRATSREMADLTGLPSSWAIAVQKAYPSNFPEWNSLSCNHSQTVLKYNNQIPKTSLTLQENFPSSSEQKTLSEEERDSQYRRILSNLELSEAHRNHLTDVRGLRAFIDSIGFRSWQETQVENVSADLPGVVERDNSLYLYGYSGLFLPIQNEFAQIIAFQIRPADNSNGKYKWGSSAPAGGNSPRLDNGEMPLAFCRPHEVKIPSIGFAEGVIKAYSVAYNLQQIIIGAPGAAWDCSPKLLRRYLEKIAQEKNTSLSNLVIDLYVDAGMLSNRHIILRYHETIKLLQQWECKIRVGWWGQFTKDDPDIDDLIFQGNRHQITYISIDEWMALWSDDIRNYLLHNSVQFNTSNWSAPVQHPYRSELGYWKKIKVIGGETEYSWIPKAGFSFIVERELIGVNDEYGGLVLQVKRTYDPPNEQDRVVVPAEMLNKVTDFINCLSRATGKVYFVNKFKIEEIHKYLHKELSAYREGEGKPYKLSSRLGCQSDGIWVFHDCQISQDGDLISEEESGWVLNERSIAKEKIPIPKINKQPEPEVLPRLVNAMRNFFGESGFMPAFFTTGTPVFLDLYNQHKNLRLFATTRAGKSVLASGILTQALAHGMPVVAMDYPKPELALLLITPDLWVRMVHISTSVKSRAICLSYQIYALYHQSCSKKGLKITRIFWLPQYWQWLREIVEAVRNRTCLQIPCGRLLL